MKCKLSRHAAKKAAFLLAALTLPAAGVWAQTPPASLSDIDASNWGYVTSPVYGTHEPVDDNIYKSAELFAGPNKLDANGDISTTDPVYFNGVLPNGRKVTPAGTTVQVGMNPLGALVTPDGKYLVISNDDERDDGFSSLQNPTNKGGYRLTVVDTSTMRVVSSVASGNLFVGLAIKPNSSGGYTLFASGGPSAYKTAATAAGKQSVAMDPGVVKLYTMSGAGMITPGASGTVAVSIPPLTPANAGFVSHYAVSAHSTFGAPGNGDAFVSPRFSAPSVASSTNGFRFTAGAQITFPAGLALSPASVDGGRYLYVACNGDNSLAVIDTTTHRLVKQIAVGYFPYGVSVSADGRKVFVSNWGVSAYKFKNATYDAAGKLTGLATTGNVLDGFYTPVTSATGSNPKTSSVSVVVVPNADPAAAVLTGAVYQGQSGGIGSPDTPGSPTPVGETHPTATVIVRRGSVQVLYVAKSNSDSLGLVLVGTDRRLADFNLSPLSLTLADGHKVHGSYPNALALSPDDTRLYVAEAGIDAVAVLDVANPVAPKLIGRIPTGWYPAGLSLSPDGNTLYILNAKGIGEDINPAADKVANPTATGVESYTDSNFVFGTAQKVALAGLDYSHATATALGNNYALHAPVDTRIVPAGGAASRKIKHVIFILHENKTFDSMLGNLSAHFGPYADLTYNNTGGTATPNGTAVKNKQYTGVSLNTQLLAKTFATAVNYYSDSEESDAGHQFAASGTASDYTEKTLLVKDGRGLLVNKNFEPEDYPEGGYIFNNAARNRVSFKDYGALVRIDGTDTGNSTPTTRNDPHSGFVGYPQVGGSHNLVRSGGAPVNAGDTGDPKARSNPFVPAADPATPRLSGLGQSYFLSLPILSVLGKDNANREPHLDKNYPGYNFNISDQRRALEFIRDFDRMVAGNTLPTFLYIYEPNDHTGNVVAPNAAAVGVVHGTSPFQQVADGDVGLGMVVDHILKSRAYYNPADGTGSALFITYDDAQSTLDHIDQHRTPLIVVSPYARLGSDGTGYIGKRHYVTASVVKTEELLMGLPPNNLGDLFATDLRDLFQPTYNGITEARLSKRFTRTVRYIPSPEGKKVWALVARLDSSGPDRDSERLGILARLAGQADALHADAVRKHRLHAAAYRAVQGRLYRLALRATSGPATGDSDD